MRGEKVIVRTFGNRAVIRRVWTADHEQVHITDDAQFAKLIKGESAIQPVCFRRADVFRCDPIIAAQLPENIDWRKLQPW